MLGALKTKTPRMRGFHSTRLVGALLLLRLPPSRVAGQRLMVEPGLPATAPVEVTDGPLTASGELLAADIAAVE